jgi:transposase
VGARWVGPGRGERETAGSQRQPARGDRSPSRRAGSGKRADQGVGSAAGGGHGAGRRAVDAGRRPEGAVGPGLVELFGPPVIGGLRKKPAQPRQRGARKPGKQPGAEGRYLAQTATPDEVVTHIPEVCDGCGAGLADAPVTDQIIRQTFDVPPLRLVTVEHRVQRRRCGCGRITAVGFPEGVSAPAVYGPGVRALITYLGVYQHLPVDRCAQLLDDVLGAPVSTGAVAAVLAEAAGRVAPAVEGIGEQLVAAPVVCFDETGARVAGRLHWCHSASTDDLTLYHVDAKRGKDAMDAAGVLPAFGGVAVHDCWSPYRSYDVAHQLCGAHILRELQAVAEQGEDWAEYLAQTLRCAKRWTDDARAGGADALPDTQQTAIRARYLGHVEQGLAAYPPPPPERNKTRPKAAALVARLDRYRDDVLRFMTDLTVPFDNNLAERDIRMVKLQLKVSGCWRTPSKAPERSRPCAATSPPPVSKASTCCTRCAERSRVTPGCPPLPALPSACPPQPDIPPGIPQAASTYPTS